MKNEKYTIVLTAVSIFLLITSVSLAVALRNKSIDNHEPIASQTNEITNDADVVEDYHELKSYYLGMTESAAVARAKEAGLSARIIGRDSEEFVVTDDLRQDRINFRILEDKVSRVEFY